MLGKVADFSGIGVGVGVEAAGLLVGVEGFGWVSGLSLSLAASHSAILELRIVPFCLRSFSSCAILLAVFVASCFSCVVIVAEVDWVFSFCVSLVVRFVSV